VPYDATVTYKTQSLRPAGSTPERGEYPGFGLPMRFPRVQRSGRPAVKLS
jgi:hypothetical protein